jgi:hypothetical protein
MILTQLTNVGYGAHQAGPFRAASRGVALMSFRWPGAAPAPMLCMLIRENSNEAYSSVPIAADASALVSCNSEATLPATRTLMPGAKNDVAAN